MNVSWLYIIYLWTHNNTCQFTLVSYKGKLMLTLLCWVYPKITQFLPLSWDHDLQYIAETGTIFNVEEDNIHVSAWLNTSIDAVHGNELKQETFCEKIWQYFYKYSPSSTTRTTGSLSSRWGTINRETSRFCGFITALEATPRSGTTEQDKV